jgi:hypothetical protein
MSNLYRGPAIDASYQVTVHLTKQFQRRFFFFPPPKSEYFFQQHWESEYFFRKKQNTPFKLNGHGFFILYLKIWLNRFLYPKCNRMHHFASFRKTIFCYFFFPPPKSEYFFQQHWESEYFFRKKQNTPFKLNGRSLAMFEFDMVELVILLLMGPFIKFGCSRYQCSRKTRTSQFILYIYA